MYIMKVLHLIFIVSFSLWVDGLPEFRILAPPFICPNDEILPIEKPNYSTITIQTMNNLLIYFDVGWGSIPVSTQRFILLLWRSIRALQKKLNGRQPEPYVYNIRHDELLTGVIYVFNVTGLSTHDGTRLTKSFSINNTIGKQTLENIKDAGDNMFSVALLGGQITFADIEFVLEAEITTCIPTQDYFFRWSVYSVMSNHNINVSLNIGRRLEIPAHSLEPGMDYNVKCLVIRDSDQEYITQTNLPIKVLRRGLKVYINMDQLVITKDTPFILEAQVQNTDYINDVIAFQWQCFYNEEKCNFVENQQLMFYNFSSGIPDTGEYNITVTVTISNEIATANSTIIVVDAKLPELRIEATPRLINEGDQIFLIGNATNVAPFCNLTWYYATETFLADLVSNNDSCDDCTHGEALSDTVIVYSLEKNFLNEIIDYTNETEWRQVTANMVAIPGRGRLVAKCGCSLQYDCETEGESYADIYFSINKSPEISEIRVTPETGTAVLTLFRISTLAAYDTDTPLKYIFYCKTDGNESLVLGSHVDHFSVETILPYNENGTVIWMEVCDSLGACSKSDPKTIYLRASDGRNNKSLIENAGAHIRRCELQLLIRVAISSIISYTNGDQLELATLFTSSLLEMLPDLQYCVLDRYQYADFLNRLGVVGIEDVALLNKL